MPEPSASSLDEKLQLERDKLDLERQRFLLERLKAKWTALATGVPLLVASLSISAAALSQACQARAQFRLKAAELVIGTDDPFLSASRAKVISAMFPKEVGTDFASSLHPEEYTGTNLNDRIRIATQLAEHPERRALILRELQRVFADDPWLEEIAKDIK